MSWALLFLAALFEAFRAAGLEHSDLFRRPGVPDLLVVSPVGLKLTTGEATGEGIR